MYTTSALYNTLIAQEGHWFETKVDINGVSYGEEELMSVNASYRVFADEQPVVGGCLSAELTIKMLTPEEQIPRMAEVRPYVRVTDGTQSSEWIPQGVFYIDTRDESHNNNNLSTTQIHCYDAMLRAEAEYPSTTHEWPMSDFEVVQEIALAMGVNIDQRTEPLMTEEYSIGLPAGFSMREVLGNIAAMYAGNWIMSFDGELRLITLTELPEETNYLVDSVYDAITFGEEQTEHEVTGAIVSFDGDGSVAQSVVAEIDASESGVSSVNFVLAGKNLWDKNKYNKYNGYYGTQQSGKWPLVANAGHTITWIKCKPNATYTVSRLRTVSNEMFAVSWSEDVPKTGVYVYGAKSITNYSSNIGELLKLTITTGATAKYLVLWAWWSPSVGAENSLQMENGDSATDYAQFSGQNLTIQLGGTYYNGASLNITTGELTAGGTTTQLDPTQVNTLLGQNNMWADSGNITVDYTYGDEVVRILV